MANQPTELEQLEPATLVRLSLFTRNARLIDTRRESGWTQVQVAEWAGISLGRLSQIERLKAVPTVLEMDNLSAVLMRPTDYLFPDILMDSLRLGVFDRREVELQEDQVAALTERAVKMTLPPYFDEHRELDIGFLGSLVAKTLKTLTQREEKVLRMRFGIGYPRPYTYEETGKEFGVTRERIRQIEAKALRKLRHPSRSKELRFFLDM